MYRVDLNSDLGESFGAYKIGCDGQVIENVTSVNIACGWHAGDPIVLNNTITLAKENGVAIGAHPGYPDLMGFGRRNMNVSLDEVYAYVLYQLGAFSAFAQKNAMDIQHVKPHGAMYNMASKDIKLATAICRAVRDFDPQIIVLAAFESKIIEAAGEEGLAYASEVFADRAYQADGSLVPRSQPGAMVTDEEIAIQRVVRMVREGRVQAITGEDIKVRADSICVHGDGPKAVAFTARIRTALAAEGLQIVNLGSFVR